MKHFRHPITGCRIDSLFHAYHGEIDLKTGIWFFEATELQTYVDLVAGLDLQQIMAERLKVQQLSALQKKDDEPEDLPWVTNANGVALMSISGPLTKYPTSFQPQIGGTSYLGIERAANLMAEDDRIKSTVFAFNTPGGSSHGSFEAGEAINRLSQKKHTIALADGKMCSAGYQLGSQCKEVFSTPSSWVGSLGSMTVLHDTSGVADAKKIKVIPIVSGSLKAVGQEGVPISPEHIAYIQELVNDSATQFIDQVQKTRKIDPEKMAKIRSEARIYTANQAHELKLTDGTKTLADVMNYAGSLPGNTQRGSKTGPITFPTT